MAEKTIWGIHPRKGGQAEALFTRRKVIAIGWPAMGDLREWADGDAYMGGPDDRLDRSSDSQPRRN